MQKTNIQPKVYIIILNYKKWQDVVECLESVFRLQYQNFTAIVIDNDSQNNSLENLQAWAKGAIPFQETFPLLSHKPLNKPICYKYFHSHDLELKAIDPEDFPQLVFIQNAHNKGFANGNNVALQLLLQKDAYVWLLNPDMVVEENTLTELVQCAQKHPPKSIIGNVIKYYEHPDQIQSYGAGKINFNRGSITITRRRNQLPHIDYINGGSLFTHTNHFKDIGLIPEDYFLYWEETDWCYQAQLKGYQLHICLSAVCYDKVSTTIGSGFMAYYYYTRNGLCFVKKYKKSKIVPAICFQILSICRWLLTNKWSRAKGVYQGMLAFAKTKTHENK